MGEESLRGLGSDQPYKYYTITGMGLYNPLHTNGAVYAILSQVTGWRVKLACALSRLTLFNVSFDPPKIKMHHFSRKVSTGKNVPPVI